MEKINWKKNILLYGYIVILLIVLVYTRFVGLDWGLPYPMHPDERNMATAVQQLNCEVQSSKFKVQNCFNPHFFAYGQFPLYLAYFMIWVVRGFRGFGEIVIRFEEAVLALRMISTVASVLTAIIIIKIIKIITKKKEFLAWLAWPLVIFSPYAIQFAHFGTTESLLMLFYSLIIYLCLLYLDKKILNSKFLILTSLVSGLALATKMSSVVFLVVPIITIMSKFKIHLTFAFLLLTLLFAVVFSPHNLINWSEFISALRYEAAVATGAIKVFYTRQFEGTMPVWFQLTKVIPYALGWLISLIGLMGLIGLSWKDKRVNLLRLAFLVYFLPNAFLFAKWSRFMAPVLPVMTVFAVLLLLKIRVINFIKIIIIIIAIIPGVVYLRVYQKPDVRFQASEWIYKNIPNNGYILSETANVVDIPIEVLSYKVHKVYKVISFNFYDLDESPRLQEQLKEHLQKADYIFVPSRRVFMNHCQMLKQKYPLLNRYYEDLFSGKLGFKKVAEFSAGLNDEQAEETWSVFDHPLIRIYKKIKD